jgi:GT2 family glycosyltransferase
VLIHSKGTITQAREKGAEMAKTAWLLFTNPDIVFDKDYFNELKKYKEEDLKHQLIYGVKVSDQKVSKYYNLLKYTQNILRLFGLPKGTDANILVNRNAFLRVEGFDFVSNYKDSEIIWKLKRWGYKILFNPKLAVYCQNIDYNLS